MIKQNSSLSLFIYTLCIVCITSLSSHAQFKVVGYLVNWSGFLSGASAVDYDKVTHINVAFINPMDASGTLGPTNDLGNVSTVVHNNNSNILASLGGAGADKTNWSAVMANATTRTAFIATLMKFVADYNLDGIDVDIEGDLLNGSTITDAQYASFISDLEVALHGQNKLLTAALGTWFGYRISNTTAQKFDWINAMAYDAYGTWTGPGQHSPYSLAVNDLSYWNNKGVDKDHLVLGVPSYGYGWVNNTPSNSYSMPYKNIVSSYARAVDQDSIKPAANQSLYYNGVPTIKDKTALAITNASGIMMWTLQNDLPTSNTGSLIRAIHDVVQATLNNAAPTVSITSPSANSVFTEGDTISITADAFDTDGTIDKVSFFASALNIGENSNLPYTINWIGAGPGTYTLTAKAKDNAYATGTSSSITLVINAATTALPFGGPYNIPGKIEMENFDVGQDLGYYDLDATNLGDTYRSTSVDIESNSDEGGGYNVGWVQGGEWLSYTVNVTAAGNYDLKVRVAAVSAGHHFHIEMDGINISNDISVPNTSGWAAFQTVTIPNVSLLAGEQKMKLVFDTGDFNINYVSFATSSVTAISDADASGSVSAAVSPNPFSQDAYLKFSLKEGGQTKIMISNMLGASPLTVTDQYFGPGDHSIALNGLNFPAGMYLCTIMNNGHLKAVKMIKE